MENQDDMSFIKDSLKALAADMRTVAERTQLMDRRLSSLETKVEQGFAAVDQKLDALTEIVSGTVAGIEDHEQRIKMLEAHAGVRGSE